MRKKADFFFQKIKVSSERLGPKFKNLAKINTTFNFLKVSQNFSIYTRFSIPLNFFICIIKKFFLVFDYFCFESLFKSVFHWELVTTYIFSVSLNFRVCYITGQWGEFRVINSTLCWNKVFWIFFCFSSKKCVLIILIFFSIWVFFHGHSRFTGQQGKGEATSFNSSLPLRPASQTLRH